MMFISVDLGGHGFIFMDISHVPALVIDYYGVTMDAIWNGLWSRDRYVMTLLSGVVSEATDVLFHSDQI